MDTKELYREILNEHNINPSHKQDMEAPTFCLEGVNPSCGDQITLQMKLGDDGKITDASFTGSGCAISQASVDMMLDDIIGKTKEEALRLSDLFTDMIHGKVSDDSALEELDEAASLKNISFMPARVKCAVLGWHTMEEMLKNGKSEGQGQASHCNI